MSVNNGRMDMEMEMEIDLDLDTEMDMNRYFVDGFPFNSSEVKTTFEKIPIFAVLQKSTSVDTLVHIFIMAKLDFTLTVTKCMLCIHNATKVFQFL
jgi:predicted alpha-1,6-mannanase (GH76 family)